MASGGASPATEERCTVRSLPCGLGSNRRPGRTSGGGSVLVVARCTSRSPSPLPHWPSSIPRWRCAAPSGRRDGATRPMPLRPPSFSCRHRNDGWPLGQRPKAATQRKWAALRKMAPGGGGVFLRIFHECARVPRAHRRSAPNSGGEETDLSPKQKLQPFCTCVQGSATTAGSAHRDIARTRYVDHVRANDV